MPGRLATEGSPSDGVSAGAGEAVVIPPGTSHMTGPYSLDELPDLTSEDCTLRDGMDGGGSTSNP